jgi:glutathione S-transferase
MLDTLTAELAKGPYLLGEPFSAADVLWDEALKWTTRSKLVPELPVVAGYLQRVGSRPAVAKLEAMDAELLRAHEAALSSGT